MNPTDLTNPAAGQTAVPVTDPNAMPVQPTPAPTDAPVVPEVPAAPAAPTTDAGMGMPPMGVDTNTGGVPGGVPPVAPAV